MKNNFNSAKIIKHFNFSYSFVKPVIKNLSTAFESQQVEISAIAYVQRLSGEISIDLEAVNWCGKNILELLFFFELAEELEGAAINHAHYLLQNKLQEVAA